MIYDSENNTVTLVTDHGLKLTFAFNKFGEVHYFYGPDNDFHPEDKQNDALFVVYKEMVYSLNQIINLVQKEYGLLMNEAIEENIREFDYIRDTSSLEMAGRV